MKKFLDIVQKAFSTKSQLVLKAMDSLKQYLKNFI